MSSVDWIKYTEQSENIPVRPEYLIFVVIYSHSSLSGSFYLPDLVTKLNNYNNTTSPPLSVIISKDIEGEVTSISCNIIQN